MGLPGRSLNATERVLALVAIIGAISVSGVQISLFLPLLSLILDARGTSSAMIGLSATAGALSVCIAAPMVPHFIRRFGMVRFMIACFVLNALCSIALKLFDNYYAWLLIRFLFSFATVGPFVSSEAWIGVIAEDHNRGQIVGIYAAALGIGFALGPAILGEVGINGWSPFLIGAGLMLLGALPLAWSWRYAPILDAPTKFNPLHFIKIMPVLACAVLLFGVIETSVYSLLPLHGLRSHLSSQMATLATSAFALGAIGLQIPIGWLADRFNRHLVLFWCGIVGFVAPSYSDFDR